MHLFVRLLSISGMFWKSHFYKRSLFAFFFAIRPFLNSCSNIWLHWRSLHRRTVPATIVFFLPVTPSPYFGTIRRIRFVSGSSLLPFFLYCDLTKISFWVWVPKIFALFNFIVFVSLHNFALLCLQPPLFRILRNFHSAIDFTYSTSSSDASGAFLLFDFCVVKFNHLFIIRFAFQWSIFIQIHFLKVQTNIQRQERKAKEEREEDRPCWWHFLRFSFHPQVSEFLLFAKPNTTITTTFVRFCCLSNAFFLFLFVFLYSRFSELQVILLIIIDLHEKC